MRLIASSATVGNLSNRFDLSDGHGNQFGHKCGIGLPSVRALNLKMPVLSQGLRSELSCVDEEQSCVVSNRTLRFNGRD